VRPVGQNFKDLLAPKGQELLIASTKNGTKVKLDTKISKLV
jgi:hypothetical protein